MKKATIILILAIALAASYLIWKPFGGTDEAVSKATSISTTVARRGDLVISVNSTGVVEPISKIDLKSKASGEIIELPVEEGDMVTKGKLIARLDATTAQNDFEQAQADLEVAKVAFDQATRQAQRQEQMFNQGLISQLDYDAALLAKEEANSAVVRARTSLEAAKERLSDTVVKSPIDGIVLDKYVEKGQIIASGISEVSGGTIIATVADLSSAYVKTSVDEVDIGQISPGQKATIIAESYPDEEFPGEVIRIHPLAKTEQNVTVFEVTTLVDNSEGLLMAGMNANVEIIAGQRENTIIVPREAITDFRTIARMASGGGAQARGNGAQFASNRQNSDGGTSGQEAGNPGTASPKIVIVVKNGDQEPRQVEIGLSNFEEAEVLSGLSEGDTVLTTVTSKVLKDREEMLERMRGWNQLPGMERRRR